MFTDRNTSMRPDARIRISYLSFTAAFASLEVLRR